jgi:hypothetical protein
MKEAELYQKLLPGTFVKDGRTNAIRYVRIKKEVPFEIWAKVQLAMTNLSFAGVEGKEAVAGGTKQVLSGIRTAAIAAEAHG